jgi:phage antirepressor YoqD-like protein
MKQTAIKIQEIRLLANDEEVLDEANDILAEKLEELNRRSRYCYTANEIGKEFGLDGADLKSFLADKKVIRKARGKWQLMKPFIHMGLTEKRYSYYMGADGHLRLKSSIVWTDQGRELIRALVYGN